MSQQREARGHEAPQDWQPCPAGELRRMLHGTRRGRRLQAITKVTAVGALLLVAATVAVPLLRPQPVAAQRIRCSDVKRLADDYLAHRLNPELNQRFEDHLTRCRGCQRLVDAHRHPDVSWFVDPTTCSDPNCPYHGKSLAHGKQLADRCPIGPDEPTFPAPRLAEDVLLIDWPDAHLAFALP